MDLAARVDPRHLAQAAALWVVYHDFAGLARAKVVPPGRIADAVREGVTFALANWDFAVNDQQVPNPGYAADSGDFRAVPDPSALVPIPYRPGVWQAEAILLDEDGRPWGGDPRGRLAAAVERLAERGIFVQVAFEAEFVLASRRAEDWVTAGAAHMFTLDDVEARWDWIGEVLGALAGMGVAAHQFAKEYGPAQFEISLLPADPVAAVDRFLLARQAIRALARDRDLVASFMPKPFSDGAGNGLHVHLSLNGAAGDDLVGGDESTELSPLARSAIGGLLLHAAGQAALAAPTPNSYKRLLPGSWAPAHICWGFGNRAALVRIPGRGSARRFEYRSGDGSANPYLHLLGLLAAVTDGIDQRLEPVGPVAIDIGHVNDTTAAALGATRLPGSLDAALASLESDTVLLDALGPAIATHYLAVKGFELACYEAEAGVAPGSSHVSRWERMTYLESL
jgi:glutamine synthetase